MQEQMITIYCVCADFLQAYGYQEDPKAQMTTAQVSRERLRRPPD